MIVYRNGSRNSVELFDPSWYNIQEMQAYQDWIDQLANHQWNGNRNIFITAIDPIDIDLNDPTQVARVTHKVAGNTQFVAVYQGRPSFSKEYFNKLEELKKYYKIYESR